MAINPMLIFALAFLSTAILVQGAIPLGIRAGLVDIPGGRRTHNTVTPLVGGVSMYIGLLISDGLLFYFQWSPISIGLLVGSGLLVLVGALDDRFSLAIRARFIVQITAALIMILQSGLILSNLGELIPGVWVDLGWTAIPFSIFAVIAVINATNMLDGIDGLAGSLTLVCFLLMSAAALVAGLYEHFFSLLVFSGMLGGFLLYNFRIRKKDKARVFMGDAGSMFLGFVLVWFFVTLSQGSRQAFAPVTAVWIFAVPLFDIAAVVLRRVRYGVSPFKADRTHLHHFLMDAGFGVRDSVLLMVSIQVLMGLVGLAGYYWAVPDSVMLLTFLALFGLYFTSILHSWRFVTVMQCFRQSLKATAIYKGKIFIGNLLPGDNSPEVQKLLGDQLATVSGYRLFNQLTDDGREVSYCILDYNGDRNKLIRHMRKQLSVESGVVIRPLYTRGKAQDPRHQTVPFKAMERRERDRRVGDHEMVEHVQGEWLSLLGQLRAYGSELRKSLHSQAQNRHQESHSCHQQLVQLNRQLEKVESTLKDKRKDREKAVALFADSKRAISTHNTVMNQLHADEVLLEGQTSEQGLAHWKGIYTNLLDEQRCLENCRIELVSKLEQLHTLEDDHDKQSLYRDASEIQGGIQVLETEYDKLVEVVKANEAKVFEAENAIQKLESFISCYEFEFTAISKRYQQVGRVADSLAQLISVLEHKKQVIQQQKRKIELGVVEGAIGESNLRVERENIRYFDSHDPIETHGLSLDELRNHYRQAHDDYEKQCLDFTQGKGTLVPSSPYQDALISSTQKLDKMGIALEAASFRQSRMKENLDLVDSQLQGLMKRGQRLLHFGE